MVFLKRLVSVLIIFVLVLIPLNVSALSTSAKAAVVLNGDNGEIIYSQNADTRLSMASTTKIMTGLLLCEYGNFQREITVTEEMLKVEGSSMGLLPGDRVTLHDLLYGLMLASGNDAANVIAFVLGGSLDGFVKMMNKKADDLGLVNTNFATPSGLDADDHYTTAYELAKIAHYAMQNDEFAKAVSSKKAVLNYGNPPYRRSLTNHNKMLNLFDGAVGIKTGFTQKSGRCLVSAAKRDGKFVIAVTLNDPNDWQDHQNMLEYGLSAIKQTEYSPKFASFNIPVINGDKNEITVNIEPITINSLETENITDTVYLPQFVYAPVSKNDVLGTVVYKQNGEILQEVEILANCDIKALKPLQKPIDKIIENFRIILQNF